MSKDDAVRLTDTITFIRTATVPFAHLGKRDTVADLLQTQYDDGLIPPNISPAMSQGHNFAIKNRDTVKENRHYRRAIMLIRSVLMGVDHTIVTLNLGGVTDAALATELGDALNEVTTALDDLTTKLAQLKTQPVTFLQNNQIHIFAAPASVPFDYGFTYSALDDLYTFLPLVDARTRLHIQVRVFHIAVQQFASLTVTSKGTGDESRRVVGTSVHGAEIMVTTQLTGCAMAYYLNGAQLVAAHVQPSGGTTGESMCTTLRDGKTTLTTAPRLTGVFGAQTVKGVDPKNYVKDGFYNYCIGVSSGGSWDLYAQQRPRKYGNQKGAKVVAWKIT